jgi:hypothetical protein
MPLRLRIWAIATFFALVTIPAHAEQDKAFQVTHIGVGKTHFYFLVYPKIPDSDCTYTDRFAVPLSDPAAPSIQALVTAAYLANKNIEVTYNVGTGQCVGNNSQAFVYLRTTRAAVP